MSRLSDRFEVKSIVMRIAQITDLHLRQAIPGVTTHSERLVREVPSLFAKAVRSAKEHSPDIIVVTGDLLDVPDDWISAQANGMLGEEETLACLADYLYIKDVLDNSELPYMVVAGNHDLPNLLWQIFERFDDLSLNGFKFIAFHDEETENHMPQRLGLERERFEETLHCVSEMPQVHLQHYVLTPTLHEGYPHSYLDDRTITEKVDESERVILSLSGHYHQGTELLHMKYAYFATGTAFCNQPHAYRIYDVDLERKHVSMKQFNV
ncbi:Calcineurin-like phosphoesterase [Poriferisphaera corsica]|uniref:Calcineurin-like phosphoesterase n=1 Tax=Poriferisphaera corsica TaxID=2528020 RepID=A0A517YTH7_9BACT|nr:metallophosphoesterase [Poriferisphaera corsica]QDU33524.1 Calcineurin-like phosphoesterase [Poriferisphaera corsica]